MMRKMKLLAGLSCVALAGFLGTPAGAATLTIDPASMTVTAGTTFTVDVSVEGVTDLYGYGFAVGFDPAILEALGIAEGAFLPGGGATLFIDGTIDNTGGTITDTGGVLNGGVIGVDGSGVLATVTFRALATGSSAISLFNPILLDSNLADIAADALAAGSVTVDPGPNGVPLPSALSLAMLGLALMRRSAVSRGIKP